jgi:hypothetical protein
MRNNSTAKITTTISNYQFYISKKALYLKKLNKNKVFSKVTKEHF